MQSYSHYSPTPSRPPHICRVVDDRERQQLHAGCLWLQTSQPELHQHGVKSGHWQPGDLVHLEGLVQELLAVSPAHVQASARSMHTHTALRTALSEVWRCGDVEHKGRTSHAHGRKPFSSATPPTPPTPNCKQAQGAWVVLFPRQVAPSVASQVLSPSGKTVCASGTVVDDITNPAGTSAYSRWSDRHRLQWHTHVSDFRHVHSRHARHGAPLGCRYLSNSMHLWPHGIGLVCSSFVAVHPYHLPKYLRFSSLAQLLGSIHPA